MSPGWLHLSYCCITTNTEVSLHNTAAETFRKELGSARSSFAVSPLEQLGFWRIVLDEAQIASKTSSVAAQMASGKMEARKTMFKIV